jgi:hypothetical protein
MPYINPTFRTIKIDEEDFNLIEKHLSHAATKCRANAEKCLNTGYSTVSSEMKAEQYRNEADRIMDLLSRLSTEMI